MRLPKKFVVTARVKKWEKPLVKGSKKVKCVLCNKLVWMSPASELAVRLGDYPNVFVCLECVAGAEK